MIFQSMATFTGIAALSILSPGPAILLSLRNGATYGARSVLWSALGNISGVFCLSTAAMLGLGAVLNSSVLLFSAVKLIGGIYLLYVGVRHLFFNPTFIDLKNIESKQSAHPLPRTPFCEAFLTAATNPKAVLFFTALFPQFIHTNQALVPQFFILTGIFMTLSYMINISYALLASRARLFLKNPLFATLLNRTVGVAFIAFGSLLLTLRRQTT